MRYFTDNPLERMMMQVPRQANATGRAASCPVTGA